MPVIVEWNRNLLKNPVQLEKYIQQNITDGAFPSQSSCEAAGNGWKSVKVVDIQGRKIMDAMICIGSEYDASNAYVIVYINGLLQIKELRTLSVSEQIRNLFEAAIRSAAVIAAIGSGLGITAITDNIIKVTNSVSALTNLINPEMSRLLKKIQAATAWIEKTFHIDILKRLNTVGMALSPEYRSTVRSYEHYLSNISDKVFGSGAFLPAYMRFYETMMYDQMRRAGEDHDTARYNTLKASYNRSKAFGDKVDTYSADPMSLWGDIYDATFEDMNPYIDQERLMRDKSSSDMAAAIAGIAEKNNIAILNIGKFATMLEVNIGQEKDPSLKTLTDRLSSFYDTEVDPAVRTVKAQTLLLEREIKKVEAAREAERISRERAALMATPPAELSDKEKAQQGTQFIKLFESSLQPAGKAPDTHKTDIEDIVKEIYE